MSFLSFYRGCVISVNVPQDLSYDFIEENIRNCKNLKGIYNNKVRRDFKRPIVLLNRCNWKTACGSCNWQWISILFDYKSLGKIVLSAEVLLQNSKHSNVH